MQVAEQLTNVAGVLNHDLTTGRKGSDLSLLGLELPGLGTPAGGARSVSSSALANAEETLTGTTTRPAASSRDRGGQPGPSLNVEVEISWILLNGVEGDDSHSYAKPGAGPTPYIEGRNIDMWPMTAGVRVAKTMARLEREDMLEGKSNQKGRRKWSGEGSRK